MVHVGVHLCLWAMVEGWVLKMGSKLGWVEAEGHRWILSWTVPTSQTLTVDRDIERGQNA